MAHRRIMNEVLAAVLTTVVPVFALVGLGYGAMRAKLMDAAAQRGLVLFAFSFAAPALLFSAGLSSEGMGGVSAIAFFAGCLATYALVFVLARTRLALRIGPAALVALNAGFGNIVAMGIPLTLAAFGPETLSILFGIIGLHSLALVGLTTVLLELDAKGTGGLRALGRVVGAVLANPIVAALLAAILWRTLGLPPLPGPVKATLDLLGAASSPVALVSLGAGLAAFRLGDGWQDVMLGTVAKLFIMPALVWGAALAIGLDGPALAVTVTAAALPTGSNPVLLAARYGVGMDRAGATVVASTLVSVLTLSVLVAVFR
ncbi:AEC family transporter [Elioraea sp.]|uniref:AEC family transporter n=1 Tax=Elioraea sp. TaxID=2185103 RepID=UPI0025C53BA4|nr:AEC family transporter [Elioraea sp.]